MKKKLLTFFLGVSVLSLSTVFTACNNESGNNGNENATQDTTAATTTEQQPAETNAPAATNQTVEIQLAAVGNTMAEMKFDQPEIHVPAGSKVHLTLVDQATDASMQHNWVLVNNGTMEEVATAGLKAGNSNDWIPTDNPNVLAHTKLLKPGETTDITFDAPAKGEYQFVCTYPGHWKQMNGKFIVD